MEWAGNRPDPLTPALSPSAGARGQTNGWRRFSLAPAEGERAGVRGKMAVVTYWAGMRAETVWGRSRQPLICCTVRMKMRLPTGSR